ncbi:MAG: hypothetical protein ACC645_21235, partial [Pirellulales bacterium]
VDLKDPATGIVGDRVGLLDLFDGLGLDIGTVANITTNGRADLHVQASTGFLGAGAPADPVVSLAWPTLASPATANIAYNADMDPLLNFEYLRFSDVAAALEQVANYVSSNDPLTDFEPQVGSLLGFADSFRADVTAVALASADSVQTAAAALESALGLSPGSVDIAVDGDDLTFEFSYAQTVSGAVPLNLDLAALAAAAGGVPSLAGITEMLEVGGTASLSVNATGALDLDLGMDLADPANPVPFLFDTTLLTQTTQSRQNGNLNFTATLGALPVLVAAGSRTFDGDGNPGTTGDSATFTVAITDSDLDGRHGFGELTGPDVVASQSGQITMTLPMADPGSGTPIGDLVLTITDIGDLNPTTTVLTSPDLNPLLGAVNLKDDQRGIDEGLDRLFARIKEGLQSEVFRNPLPIIGAALADESDLVLAQFDQIRTAILTELAAAAGGGGGGFQAAGSHVPSPGFAATVVRQSLFNAFGPGGLDLLDKDFVDAGDDDVPDPAATIDDIVVAPNIADITIFTSEVTYDFRLVQQEELHPLPSDGFDLALGAFDLTFEAGADLRLMLGWSLPVRFGINRTQGFFYDSSTADELTISVDARIPDLRVNGRLGKLAIQGSDEDADTDPNNNFDANGNPIDQDGDGVLPSSLTGTLAVNLGTVGETLLTSGDLSSLANIANIVQGKLDATADINLDVSASFGDDPDTPAEEDNKYPSAAVDVRVDWQFTNTVTDAKPDSFGSLPLVEFRDLRMDLRETFDFIDEQLQSVRAILDPYRDLVELAITPLPVLSDLLGDTTLLDVLAFANILPGDWETLIGIIDGAFTLIDLVPNVPAGTVLHFGTVQFDNVNADLRAFDGIEDIPFANLTVIDPVQGSLLDQLDAATPDGSARMFFDATQNLGGTGTKIDLPIFEETQLLFRILTSLDPSHDSPFK